MMERRAGTRRRIEPRMSSTGLENPVYLIWRTSEMAMLNVLKSIKVSTH